MTQKRAVTLKDIARIAGVSVGSASNVVNGLETVKPITKAKVEAAIAETGYKVNMQARSMISNRSTNIGVVAPFIQDYYVPRLVNTIELFAERHKGYNIQITASKGDAATEVTNIERLLSKQIDGIICISHHRENASFFEKLVKNQTPFVLLTRHFENSPISYVVGSNHKVSEDAVKYLHKMGHREIALVTDHTEDSVDKERLDGFNDACESFNLKKTIRTFSALENKFKAGYTAIYEFRETGRFPTAVYAVDERVAIGCMKACYELNIRIPDDLSIISVGTEYPEEMMLKRLTTFDSRAEVQGQKAVEALFEQIEFKDANPGLALPLQEIVVEKSFVEGESVKFLS